MTWLRMVRFGVVMFAKTPFFVQTLWTSTLAMLALQWLLHQQSAGDGNDALAQQAWWRAAWAGAWATSTVSAGLVGFQRFQGTLAPLVMSVKSPVAVIFTTVAAAGTFGLLAFPLAAGGAALLGMPPSGEMGLIVASCLVFWVGCLAMSAVFAALFVLTPHAITYEVVLLVPFYFVSGILPLPASTPDWLLTLTMIVPTRGAVEAITPAGIASPTVALGSSLLVSVLWLAAGYVLGRLALKKAIAYGTLEIV